MTLIQLTYFIRAVEMQSLSKAASVVRIAQPALGRQIRSLERELGVELLVRHGWGVTATPAGAVLVEHGRQILKTVEAARTAVSGLAASPTGPVSLTVPSTLAMTLLPLVSTGLRDRYPDIRPHFMDSFTSGTPARLLAGQLDLAILNRTVVLDPLIGTPLLSEDLALVGRPGVAPGGGASTSEILRATPLVLPSRPNSLRLLVDQATRGATENIALETDSLPAMLGIAKVGRAFAVLPFSTVVDDVTDGKLVAHSFGDPAMSWTLALVRVPGRQMSPAMIAVENEVRKAVRDLATERRWTPH